LNPDLDRLHPYPFEKLRKLFEGIVPRTDLKPIRLSIGEPQHPAPGFIAAALIDKLEQLSVYPTTQGGEALRGAIAAWLERRYGLAAVNPATQVLPVNGTREALFAFAQCVVDRSKSGALVLSPNPFYQIYEGAAFLAGATPVFLNNLAETDFTSDFAAVPDITWRTLSSTGPATPAISTRTGDAWAHDSPAPGSVAMRATDRNTKKRGRGEIASSKSSVRLDRIET
jgi:N-succinyldiaminopimelate aminotransferase